MADEWAPPKPELVQITPVDADGQTTIAMGTIVCPLCRSEISGLAKICPECQSTRRRVGSKWQSYRQGRQNDIIIAAITLWILSGLLTLLVFGGILIVSNSGRTASSKFSAVASAIS